MKMPDYAYAGRNLFAEVESYEYAKCAGDRFLGAWAHHRREIARLILDGAQRAGVSAPAPAAAPPAGGITLADLLSGIADAVAGDGSLAERHRPAVHLLLAKFEIFRRLFRSYTADLRKAPGAEEAGIAEYIQFGNVLALFSRRLDNPLYLSTLLKLVDALCSLPPELFTRAQALGVAELIRLEGELVADWKTRGAE